MRIFKENGWVLDRIEGFHHIFVKEVRRSVPVPVHKGRGITKDTIRRILKEAGIS